MSSQLLQNKWNAFIQEAPAGSFLQSWEWGEFQNEVERKVWHFVVSGKKKIRCELLEPKTHNLKTSHDWLLTSLVIKYELPFGRSYLYAPRGPVADFLKERRQSPGSIFAAFLHEIKKIAKAERAIFFRIDPEWLDTLEMREFLNKLGAGKSSKEVQPKETIIVDVKKSESKLLEAMHEKTRYNIRLAERKGVSVSQYQKVKMEDFEEVWRLFRETAKRDKFRLHERAYYEKMLNLGGTVPPRGDCPPYGDLVVELFTARYEGKLLAANIVTFFGRPPTGEPRQYGGRATYLHGASSHADRNVMAPYLLHWEIIKEAKRRGCQEYDLWGISEKKWPGVTRFKKGFGGDEVHYIGAYDFVFDRVWNKVYRLAHRIKDFR